LSSIFNIDKEILVPQSKGCLLAVSIGNQTAALYIDTRLHGDVTSSASRKMFCV